MKRLYKNIIAILVAVLLCMNMNVYDAKAAATVSVSVSASTVSIGQSVTVSVSVSGADISAYTVYISYSSSVLQYTSGSGSASINGGGGTVIMSGTGSGSATLSFTAIANGTASIYTSGELYDINLNAIETSYGGASVTVATVDNSGGSSDGGNSGGSSDGGSSNQPVDDRSSNCYIADMQVSPGTLEPEFSYDTYEYTLRVEESVKEITISASTDDSKASIQVKGADEIKPGKNTVEVICTAENGAVKTYTIEVIAGEILEDVVINVGGMDYSIVNFSEDIISVPELFTKTTVKYDKWDILAYESPNKMLKLVCLQDSVDNQKWFIYNEATSEFTEYKEYSAKYNRYVIIPFPADAVFPEDFVLTQVTIFGTTVDAYQSADMNDPDKYIIYAMNLDAEEGYYIFDNVEKTFMKYNMPEVATETDAVVATVTDADVEEDEGFFTKQNMFYILCGAGALLLILLICLIGFGVKIGKLNKELDEADMLVAKATKNNLDSVYGIDEKSAKKADVADKSVDESEDKKEDIVEEAKSEVEKAIEEKIAEETNAQEATVEEDKSPVSEIPVVDLGMGDVSEYEEQAKEINEIISENYDADMDSAFAEDVIDTVEEDAESTKEEQ